MEICAFSSDWKAPLQTRGLDRIIRALEAIFGEEITLRGSQRSRASKLKPLGRAINSECTDRREIISSSRECFRNSRSQEYFLWRGNLNSLNFRGEPRPSRSAGWLPHTVDSRLAFAKASLHGSVNCNLLAVSETYTVKIEYPPCRRPESLGTAPLDLPAPLESREEDSAHFSRREHLFTSP